MIGSRSFEDRSLLFCVLDKHYITEIISGGAKGADTFSEEYAIRKNISHTTIKPNWYKYPKTAGFVRNKEIIRGCDVVIAFWDGISGGTLDSLKHAQKLKKKIIIVGFGELTSEEIHGNLYKKN